MFSKQEVINIEKREVNQYSPLTLAFLGDAVYSQLVREKLVLSANMPVKKLHPASVERVKANYQARAAMLIEPLLTEDEAAVMKRGRNASCGSGSIPKNSDPVEYHKATSLETLFGYLHLLGEHDRITELFEYIWSNTEVNPVVNA
ncbi:MAG: ribonuclease III [Oscillospiraceae bacterium]|nr:ribonuclease III [Oscillospiraceae bacterium]